MNTKNNFQSSMNCTCFQKRQLWRFNGLNTFLESSTPLKVFNRPNKRACLATGDISPAQQFMQLHPTGSLRSRAAVLFHEIVETCSFTTFRNEQHEWFIVVFSSPLRCPERGVHQIQLCVLFAKTAALVCSHILGGNVTFWFSQLSFIVCFILQSTTWGDQIKTFFKLVLPLACASNTLKRTETHVSKSSLAPLLVFEKRRLSTSLGFKSIKQRELNTVYLNTHMFNQNLDSFISRMPASLMLPHNAKHHRQAKEKKQRLYCYFSRQKRIPISSPSSSLQVYR